MSYLVHPVAYLNNEDFDDNGVIINPAIPVNLMPVVIMIQANWCFHCSDAKPYFQEAGNILNGVAFFATIQSDGADPSVKEFVKTKLKKLAPNLRGFPYYCVQYKGQTIEYRGGRDTGSLVKFVNELAEYINKNNI